MAEAKWPFHVKDTDGKFIPERLRYLSVDQAIADSASLLFSLRSNLCLGSSFIGFGGSYGGMLGYWLSVKYPDALDGLVAASAPVFEFLGHSPAYDQGSYAEQVTRDASMRFDASLSCSDAIRSSWQRVFFLSRSQSGRATLSSEFKLCKPLKTEEEALQLANWASSAFDFMAMGSYPYPSTYMLNGGGILPAFPLREACRRCAHALASNRTIVSCLRNSVAVFFNATKDKECFDMNLVGNVETSENSLLWDYISCTDLMQPLSRDGKRDMFWDQPFNQSAYRARCLGEWGVAPRPYYAKENFGGWKALKGAAKNVIFTNGELDPWKGGGVNHVTYSSRSVHAVVIPGVGHHIDLMWSHPSDTSAVRKTRNQERSLIRQWIIEANMTQRDSRIKTTPKEPSAAELD